MNERKDRVARELAEAHFQLERGVQRIIRLVLPDESRENTEQEPIKLLEINQNTVSAGILPVYFGPHARNGIFYPSIIVEITPEEFEDLERDVLQLPNGWQRGYEYEKPLERASA